MQYTVIISGDDQIEEFTLTARQSKGVRGKVLYEALLQAKEKWPNAKHHAAKFPTRTED